MFILINFCCFIKDFALDTADLLISPSKGICTLFSETGNVVRSMHSFFILFFKRLSVVTVIFTKCFFTTFVLEVPQDVETSV